MEYLESACKINNAYRNSFHHKTYALRAHMLASYMTAVQISRLLKPHARFVNRNNVIISSS